MQRLRHLLVARPSAVAWLVACVLAMRMLVPGGYMPVATSGGIVLGLCPGTQPVTHAAMAGMHHGDDDRRDEAPTGAAMPCAFAGAGPAALDLSPVRAAPVAQVVAPPANGRTPSAPVAAGSVRWRPPLRAPPIA